MIGLAVIAVDRWWKAFFLFGFDNAFAGRGVSFDLPDDRILGIMSVPPGWIIAAGVSVIIVLGLLLVLVFRRSPRAAVGVLFLLYGGGSNILDRVLVGSVVDYLTVPAIKVSFNLADALILAGAVWLFFFAIRRRSPKPVDS